MGVGGYCTDPKYREYLLKSCCVTCSAKETATTAAPTSRMCPTDPIVAMWDVSNDDNTGYTVMVTDKNKIYGVDDNGNMQASQTDFKTHLNQGGLDGDKPADAVVVTSLGSGSKLKYEIIFQGGSYSLYTKMARLSGPHSIYDKSGPLKVTFPRYVKQLTGAMKFYTRKTKVYFFFRFGRTGWYMRYDSVKQTFDAGYPKPVNKGFLDVPQRGIDAAVSSQRTKKTYFISEDKLYRIAAKNAKVMKGYPKLLGTDLIKCEQPAKLEDEGFDIISHLKNIFSKINLSYGPDHRKSAEGEDDN